MTIPPKVTVAAGLVTLHFDTVGKEPLVALAGMTLVKAVLDFSNHLDRRRFHIGQLATDSLE